MIPNILCIDTSLEVCSVAIGEFYVEETGLNIHSSRLNMVIEKLMQLAGLKLDEIGAVCIDKGPGSYTGLRIGVSTAKGLCYALDKPLISTNTLQTMAYYYKSISPGNDNQLLCPMIDARRLEVYYALFDNDLKFIRNTQTGIIDESFLEDILSEKQVLFLGNGASKCKPFLSSHPNAIFPDLEIYPSAKAMMSFAIQKYEQKDFEDIFSFEPFYLKDFYFATPLAKSKK